MADGTLELNSPYELDPVAVGSVPTPILPPAYNNSREREGVTIQPEGGDIRIGSLDRLTSTRGIKIFDGQQFFFEWTRGTNWYAIKVNPANTVTLQVQVHNA